MTLQNDLHTNAVGYVYFQLTLVSGNSVLGTATHEAAWAWRSVRGAQAMYSGIAA